MEDTWPREDPNPGQNVAQRWTDGSPFTYVHLHVHMLNRVMAIQVVMVLSWRVSQMLQMIYMEQFTKDPLFVSTGHEPSKKQQLFSEMSQL